MKFSPEETQQRLSDLAPMDGKSHVKGAIDPPLAHITISELLRDTAKTYGDREALIFPSYRLTYSDFNREVDALAKGFLALGLEK